MNKEEIIKLLETLKIEKIKSVVIKYTKEKNYGYGNAEEHTLKIDGDRNE